MSSEASILPVIRRLYDAATDAERWPAFLAEVAHHFEADGAHLARVQPREWALSFSILYGYDDAVLRLYGNSGSDLSGALARFERHFASLMPTDPRVRRIEQFPSRAISCRLAMSDAELHAAPVYRELLYPANVEYTLAVSAREDDGSLIVLALLRKRERSFFTEEETERFSELLPHVKQAVAVSEHLARVDFSNRAAIEALDALAVGLLIVDEDARALHINAAARRVIDLADGISLCNGVLRLNAKEEDSALRQAVWRAVAEARSGRIPPGEALAVRRPSGREPFPVMVGTLWGNHLRYGLGRLDKPLAVVLVTIPEEPQEAPAELLRRLFGLTLSEARLCERLVQGRTLDEAAQDLDIVTGTARIHLKSVFAKTGVSRQAELVAKILSTPVWLRRASPPS